MVTSALEITRNIYSLCTNPDNNENGLILPNSLGAWYSTNPNDLAPLIGTTWIFTYTVESTYNNTITFGTNVDTTSDGSVALWCSNQYGISGAVFYTDLIQGGQGFVAIIESSGLIEFYSFTIDNNGNTATGYYNAKIKSIGEYLGLIPMIGIKSGGTTTSTVPSLTTSSSTTTSIKETTTIKPITIINHVMTKDPSAGGGCEIPIAISNFSTNDVSAFCWFNYANGTIGTSIEWKFYGPNMDLYAYSDIKIEYAEGCAWSGIFIQSYDAQYMPGNWYVEVYYGGAKQFSNIFTITNSSTTPVPTTSSTTTSIKANNPPNPPLNPFPVDLSKDVETESVMLFWEGSDSDGDSLTYEIYFGSSSLELLASNVTTTRYEVKDLKGGMGYNWKIVAIDNKGLSTNGPTWSFSTKVAIASACPAKTAIGDDRERLNKLYMFRDNVLAKSVIGQKIIDLYYKTAPHINNIIKNNPVAKDLYKKTIETVLSFY